MLLGGWRWSELDDHPQIILRETVRQGVLMARAREWAREHEVRLGGAYATQKLQVRPRRWVVKRRVPLDRPEQKDEQRLRKVTEISEAFIYVAIGRLIARRLARS
jgi:hypothetical protein